MVATLVDILARHAVDRPDRLACTALDHTGSEIGRRTFADLDARCRAIAAWLQREGLADARVLLLVGDSLPFVEAFMGCLYAGVVAVPVAVPRPHRPLTQLRAIARDAGLAGVLTTRREACVLRPALAGDLPEVAWLHLDEMDGSGDDWSPSAVQPERLAFLQYTSGSTGTPKGVMVTQANLMHNEAVIQHAMRLTPASVSVSWLPLYHDMGLIGNVLQPLYTGFNAVLMPPVAFIQKPIRWLDAITRYGGTVAGAPNFAYDLCVDRTTEQERARLDLRRWTVAYSGSEPVRAATLARFSECFAVCGFERRALYPCYGLAESTLFVSGNVHRSAPEVLSLEAAALATGTARAAPDGQLGTLLVGCGTPGDTEVRIVDPDTGAARPEDGVGEIWIRSRSVCRGYHQRPIETAATFDAAIAGAGGEAGFLRTGDLGFLHQGRLFITGRLKDLIIIRGRNHYPHDLEATAAGTHPALLKDAGIAVAIEERGQTTIAIAHELTREACATVDPGEVIAAVRQGIATEHDVQVGRVLLLKPGHLPRTTSGKLRRSACREMIDAGAFETIDAPMPRARARAS